VIKEEAGREVRAEGGVAGQWCGEGLGGELRNGSFGLGRLTRTGGAAGEVWWVENLAAVAMAK